MQLGKLAKFTILEKYPPGMEIRRIADIVVQGISFASVIRSEFVAVIDSHGGEVESLLVELRKKTMRLQAASG